MINLVLRSTDNPLYANTRYNDKIRFNGNLSRNQELVTHYARILYLILINKETCFGYLLESPHVRIGDSIKHPTHLFYGEIFKQQNKTFLTYQSAY